MTDWPAARQLAADCVAEMLAEADAVSLGINPIVALEKQPLNMIGNLV